MKKLASFVVAVGVGSVAHSQDYDRLHPQQLPASSFSASTETVPPSATRSKDDRVIVRKLKAVVFVPTAEAVKSRGISGVRGLNAEQVPLLQSPEFAARMDQYLGQPLTMAALNAIQGEVATYFMEKDRPVVNALVPEQDITSGVLQIVVLEGRLGEVRVTGNQWFKPSIFRAGVRLREGEPIRKSHLQADTRYLNGNPFRTVDTVFAPGTTPGTTDLELRVQDRLPVRAYVGYDNTGTEQTDYNRLFAGVNWGNAFGLDHQFNYQFTASPDFDQLLAHSASYVIPLPWRHNLTFFGSYATTHPELPEGFDLDGRTWQVSFRYTVPLPDVKEYTHEVALGYDFKSSNNDLAFGGQTVFATPVDISQIALTYRGSLPDRWGSTSLNGELYWSPGGMGSHNNDQDFEAAAPGASSGYVYGKLSLQRTTRLPADFSLVNSFTGQLAGGPLYASEQLGVGGSSSVRGYAEYEASGDQGFLMSHELRTPALHPLSHLNPKLNDNLQFLAFWDYGIAHLKEPGQGTSGSVHLSSVGVGLRYAINTNLTVRADYGWQLIDTGLNDDFDSRLSVGVTLSY